MKQSMICLDYTFLFSKESNIWNHLSEFEADLADFFSANGLEAESVQTVSGSFGRRVILIRKMEFEGKLVNTKGVNLQSKPQTSMPKSKTIVNKLTNKLGKSFDKKGGAK